MYNLSVLDRTTILFLLLIQENFTVILISYLPNCSEDIICFMLSILQSLFTYLVLLNPQQLWKKAFNPHIYRWGNSERLSNVPQDTKVGRNSYFINLLVTVPCTLILCRDSMGPEDKYRRYIGKVAESILFNHTIYTLHIYIHCILYTTGCKLV